MGSADKISSFTEPPDLPRLNGRASAIFRLIWPNRLPLFYRDHHPPEQGRNRLHGQPPPSMEDSMTATGLNKIAIDGGFDGGGSREVTLQRMVQCKYRH